MVSCLKTNGQTKLILIPNLILQNQVSIGITMIIHCFGCLSWRLVSHKEKLIFKKTEHKERQNFHQTNESIWMVDLISMKTYKVSGKSPKKMRCNQGKTSFSEPSNFSRYSDFTVIITFTNKSNTTGCAANSTRSNKAKSCSQGLCRVFDGQSPALAAATWRCEPAAKADALIWLDLSNGTQSFIGSLREFLGSQDLYHCHCT